MKRSLLTLAILSACAASYVAGRSSHQNVNDLIRVGFLVVAPPDTDSQCASYDLIALTAGEESLLVERFDEGIATLFPSYWTTSDRADSP